MGDSLSYLDNLLVLLRATIQERIARALVKNKWGRFFYDYIFKNALKDTLTGMNSDVSSSTPKVRPESLICTQHDQHPHFGVPLAYRMRFGHNKNLQTPPPVGRFPWAYEVAQSPHESNMSRANTRFATRFCDNNWEKGKDFVKICRV